MAIEIMNEPNISLDELQTLHRSGVSVVRTAHVGNQRPYNLAVAEAGLPMQLVDHTIVAQQPGDAGDNNYLPGSVVTAESITPLELDGPPGRLTSKTIALEPGTGTAVYLDQLHIASLRQAFPANPEIRTNTEYIRAAELISGEVITIALDVVPRLFERTVEADGTVHKVEPHGYAGRFYRFYGILELNPDPHTDRGIILPNEVDIVLGFVIEALHKGGHIQYHLSGPDFLHYIKDYLLQQQLNILYSEVRRRASFGTKLPEDLTVKMVPATEARFLAALGRGGLLHQIFAKLEEKSGLEAEKRTFFSQQDARSPTGEQFIREMRKRDSALGSALGQLALDATELFLGARDAPYTSQYDVLVHRGTDAPAENRSSSFHELHVIQQQLAKLRKRAP